MSSPAYQPGKSCCYGHRGHDGMVLRDLVRGRMCPVAVRKQ